MSSSLSNEARIVILLGIDILFFFVEIISGMYTTATNNRLRCRIPGVGGRQFPHAQRCHVSSGGTLRRSGMFLVLSSS